MKTYNLVVHTSKYQLNKIMSDFKVMTTLALALCVCGSALAAPATPTAQPIPILKQVNRQNEDGSYSYGYENADGTFKIETKYPTGEVYGKYGYVDETGKLRTIEYGASAGRGFEPSGTGITVPPPVVGGDSNDLHRDPLSSSSQDDYDDGQYREDPSIYYKSDVQQSKKAQAPAARQQQWSTAGNQQQWSTNTNQQQWSANANQQQWSTGSAKADSRQFQSHPSVHNFDPMTGSFSISYSG